MTTRARSLSVKRKRIFIALAAFLGLISAAMLSEVALRVYLASRGWTPNCYVTSYALLTSDAEAGYTLRKSVQVKSSGYHIRLNSLGLRGPEISKTKPAGVTRIAVLGGSSVFGYLVPEGEDSCRVMEDSLRQQGIAVEVLNAGVSGYSITQCRHRYQDVIAPLRPDIVMLYLGWNDSPFLIATPEQTGLTKTLPAPPWLNRMLARSTLYGFLRFRLFPEPTPVFAPPQSSNSAITDAGAEGFRSDYIALLEAVKASGARPVISTQVMASNERCEGLEGYLGDTPRQQQANRAIGQWITRTVRELAIEHQLLLVDCDQEIPCNVSTLGDTIHLTKEGHRQVAELWAESITSLLKFPDTDDGDPEATREVTP